MSCSCCAQCQAELRDAQMELGRALVERYHAILARDHVKELLADAKLDLANMTKGVREEDLEPGEDWAAKHCDPHVEGCRCRACYPVTEPDTSERDFRRALVVAIAGGVATRNTPHPGWVCDCAAEVAGEQLRRERGGK